MIVENSIEYKIKDLYFPELLLGRITMVFTCEINAREEKILNSALILLTKQFEHENLTDLKRTTLIFTENGNVSIKMPEDVEGVSFNACIFPVRKWREKNRNEVQILTIMLEELCHHFWSIEDELLVKYKVTDIMRWLDPNLKITDLYTGLEEYEEYQRVVL